MGIILKGRGDYGASLYRQEILTFSNPDYSEPDISFRGEQKQKKYGIFQNVYLTDEDLKELEEKIGSKVTDWLPIHVGFLIDEFANIGLIPKFEKLIATIRSREISARIILQAQSQLKTIYKDHADTIVGNCDSTLFLGGKEKKTLKEISETLGKETIDLYNTSETRSNQKSFGLNYQKTGKELMSQDEITIMDGGKCIFQLRGVRPFLSDKFDITKHKNYKLLENYDKRNFFDIQKYPATRERAKLRKNTVVTKMNIPLE